MIAPPLNIPKSVERRTLLCLAGPARLAALRETTSHNFADAD